MIHLVVRVARAALLLMGLCAAWPAAAQWRYITLSPDEPEGVDFRAVRLSPDVPSDLRVTANLRGSQPVYGQLRYGTDGSVRVTLVVDRISGDEADVYLDTNRDRIIDDQDRVPGTGILRRVELEVEVAEDVVSDFRPRWIWLRLSRQSDRAYVGTDGFAEGKVTIADREITSRRVDANANGLFADGDDRLWLDLNQDGMWSPIREQFPYLPILRVGEGRYAVRADRLGEALRLEPITGEGQIQLGLEQLPDDAQLLKLQVMLQGDDGSAFSISGIGTPVTAPIGNYSVGAVTALILRAGEDRPWYFVFSRPGGDRPEIWYHVETGQEVTIDPLQGLRFELELPNGDRIAPGQSVTVRPRLYTRDGLWINASSRGEPERRDGSQDDNPAAVTLQEPAAKVLETCSSGFA